MHDFHSLRLNLVEDQSRVVLFYYSRPAMHDASTILDLEGLAMHSIVSSTNRAVLLNSEQPIFKKKFYILGYSSL